MKIIISPKRAKIRKAVGRCSGPDRIGFVKGAGIGIGNVFGSLLTSIARNPSLKDELFKMAILGFALTEAIALFALMIAFLLLFAL